MRERDKLFGGVQPALNSRHAGKKKKEKKRERSAADTAALPETPVSESPSPEPKPAKKADKHHKVQETLPGMAESENRQQTPEPAQQSAAPTRKHPAPDMSNVATELARLREELKEQRDARAALESRLRQTEARLKEAEAQAATTPRPQRLPAAEPRPSAAATVTPTIDDMGIFAPAAAPVAKTAPVVLEALETWLMEAELRAGGAAGVLGHAAEPIPTLFLESAPEGELAGRMASTRLALEAAEARAAHNARQVKKLTEELAEARAAQMRAEARIRALENRLNQTEKRAGLLDRRVEEEESESRLDSLSLSIDTLRETARESEFLDTAHLTAYEEETSLLEEPGPPEEELELLPDTAAPSGDTLSLIEGDAASADTGIGALEEAVPGTDEEDDSDLSSALAAWGAQADEAAPPAAAPRPSESLTIEPVISTQPEEQEALGLEEALSGWGALEDADLAAEEVETPDLPPEMGEEEVSAPESSEEPQLEPLAAPSAELVQTEAAGGPATTESVPEPAPELKPETPAPPRRERLLEALNMWNVQQPVAVAEKRGKEARAPQEEAATAGESKKKTGKEAMVDALLRFMGPES